MDYPLIFIIIAISTLILYILFLVLGVAGIKKNRKAQGLNINKK